MALPQAGVNMVAVKVLPIADLGLAASVTSANDVTSVAFHTGCPAKIILISKLTSGSGSIYMDKAASAAALTLTSGAAVNMSVSGTSEQVATLSTDSSKLVVGLKQHTASAMVFDELCLLVTYNVVPGLEAGSIKHSINAVMNSTVGTGSGDYSLGIA